MRNTANSVDVYRNLHNGLWSVRSRFADSYGRVIAHKPWLTVFHASLVVNERGRQKVLAEKRKNVHAFVRGEMEDTSDGTQTVFYANSLLPLTYNPYKMGSFYNPETNEPVLSAYAVLLGRDGKVRYLP